MLKLYRLAKIYANLTHARKDNHPRSAGAQFKKY